MQGGLRRIARPLPSRHVREVLVVAERFAVIGLMLGPEVPAAGLLTLESVAAHEHAELEEVLDPARLLEGLVETVLAAGASSAFWLL